MKSGSNVGTHDCEKISVWTTNTRIWRSYVLRKSQNALKRANCGTESGPTIPCPKCSATIRRKKAAGGLGHAICGACSSTDFQLHLKFQN